MPLFRQDCGVIESNLLIRSLALGLPGGMRLDPHSHPWPQLIYASSGVLTVETRQGYWVIPPQRAVWVPADLMHEVVATGEVTMRTLYIRPGSLLAVPEHCSVVHVTPLLRELILHVVELGFLDSTIESQARLAHVVFDLLEASGSAPLDLPMPRDPRARRVANRMRSHLDSEASLAELSHGSGASPRTIERIFKRETGLTLGRWRQQARLLHALGRLAEGASVTDAGLDVGYDSTSAFIAMFKSALGTTPGRYFDTKH